MKWFVKMALLVVVGLGGCKGCDDEKPTPDPCKDQYKTSADFKVEESLGDYWIECDSVDGWSDQNKVRFTAKFDADSFLWTIGRETIRSKSFIRTTFPKGQWISVKLKVYRKNPSAKCFPGDIGVDSMTRSIYVWPEEQIFDEAADRFITVKAMPIQGIYRGYYESNPNKRVEIILEDSSFHCNGTYKFLYQENMPYGYKSYPLSENQNMCGLLISRWIKRPTAALINLSAYKNYTSTTYSKDSTINTFQELGLAKLSRDLKTINISFQWRKGFALNAPLNSEVFHGTKIQ
jgi:hypothetical protein